MAAVPELTSQELEFLCRSGRNEHGAGRVQLLAGLRQFVEANESPSTSANFRSEQQDPVDCFVELLQQGSVQKDPASALLLLKVLKVLSRKQDNRLRLGEHGIRALLVTLSPPLDLRIAAEGANVILNICYEQENVLALVRLPGAKVLIGFLATSDEDLQANAAGAVQSICFQPKGRKAIRELRGIPALLALLGSSNGKVVSRAVGAVHNLSSDADSIKIIRKHGGVPVLVGLLDHGSANVAASAAGALQNVSRELASRMIIREMDAVPPLARLLTSDDLSAQVCASGALLNILGPELDGLPGGMEQRRGLGKMMSLLMATSIVYEGLFDQPPPLT